MGETVKEWLKSGDYLPPCLRDFHDQKDLFRAMHEFYREAFRKRSDEQGDLPQWVGGQIYVIDFFLWFMAAHGYTLQQSRKRNIDFVPLADTVGEFKERQMEAFRLARAERAEVPG